MSPAATRSESEVLAESLDAFRAGDTGIKAVKGLSDLSRGGRATLEAAWPELSDSVRRRITRQMATLASERVELNFGRALRVALTDPLPAIRREAVAALWEDESSDLRERLERVVSEDTSAAVRTEAVRALGRFARLAVAGEDEEGAAHLRDVLLGLAEDPAQPEDVRCEAIAAVGTFGDDEAAALVAEAHDSEHIDLRIAAVRAMGHSMDAAWLETLTADLDADEAEIRREAAQAIGQIGDPRVVQELAAACADVDAGVRAAAIAALGSIGGTAATKALRAVEEQANPADQAAIAAALEEARGGPFPF